MGYESEKAARILLIVPRGYRRAGISIHDKYLLDADIK
jgi:hypothetical protein